MDPWEVVEQNWESNGHNPATQSKDDKTQQSAVNDDDSNRYYYLIKQKYSPSRHQKYRPSKKDGALEKTVSNKPLKDRIIQSNSDVVAYFMPKGSHSIPSILILVLILFHDLFRSIEWLLLYCIYNYYVLLREECSADCFDCLDCIYTLDSHQFSHITSLPQYKYKYK